MAGRDGGKSGGDGVGTRNVKGKERETVRVRKRELTRRDGMAINGFFR